MQIVAFDFGEKKIGVAVGQTSTYTSSPLQVIFNNHDKVNWNEIIFKMLQIKGIYGREMYETWYKMIALLQSGLNIENVITHKFHFTDFEKAFKIIKDGNCGKIILNWS